MDYRNISREELDQLAGEPLPERAAMSLIVAKISLLISVSAAVFRCCAVVINRCLGAETLAFSMVWIFIEIFGCEQVARRVGRVDPAKPG